MYRLSRLRVRLGAEKGHWRPKILSEILPDGAGLLLSLLVANNLANALTVGGNEFIGVGTGVGTFTQNGGVTSARRETWRLISATRAES